ncbi:MAG: isoprenylcysteine carboxylmethyltransferase family protein [Chthoniobacteraceae bacterium]
MKMDAAHLVPIVTVVVLYVIRMSELSAKRDTVPGKKTQSVTFQLFMLCGILIVVGGIAEFVLRQSVLWWPTFVAGVVFSLVAFWIRRAAIHALGRFWSVHVEMREGHEFVTSGPFAYARHPVYFSVILELLGGGLVVNAWITLAVVFAIYIPALVARLKLEEHALEEKFGEAYRKYRESTPAIFPTGRQRREP